jgi:hypothetical protein
MELVRLIAPLAKRNDVARLATDHTVLFQCSDANTVLVSASLSSSLGRPFGVWLKVSDEYPAQLAARDIATLATLVPLGHVVIEASMLLEEHVDVVRALLTNDEVNFSNDVATLSGAYNRPAPSPPLVVWSSDTKCLFNGSDILTPRRVDTNDVGKFTYFE